MAHKKVYTAFDAAETQHAKLSDVGKAVLVKSKEGLYLAVLPAGQNTDFKKLSKLIGAKVSMAKEREITAKLKTKIGLIAPFGSLYGLPVYLDNKLARAKKLILPAGSYTESVQISSKDYLRLENPILGNFSVKKSV